MQSSVLKSRPEGASIDFSESSTPTSIVARLAAQAIARANQTAVADETNRLTFAELESRSNQLAAILHMAGAGPEKCVGLFFDRSVDFVVAAIAVLKSGAAYLPLDPATPPERAALILCDADAKLLLTHRSKASGWNLPLKTIESDLPESEFNANTPDEFSPLEADPDSLAYIVYTSGSSGKPKGVEITHANLLNLIDWHQEAFNVTASDRASQVAGLAFDAAAWEIWPHLTAGASLHIAEERTRRSPQTLRDWLLSERITISFVPTVLAEPLLNATWPADTALRTLLTGADVLHRHPHAGLPFVLVNNYGPSECTVVSTSGIVAANGVADCATACTTRELPTIGAPIRNTTILILDENLRPVPMGEPGELCVGGALVGRGYRNLPELTATRFVTYTPETGPAMRIYRTGDRARLLPNGELAFLGRLDEQIKIRGYRIEPGEIVAWLDRFPGIEASAIAAKDSDTGLTLIAYLVAGERASFTGNDLREYLATRLPDYMIPTSFVKVAALPMTANGKLDKNALPAPTADNLLPHRDASSLPTAEGESVQARLAALVASLLKQPSVEIDDNFFMIGGHSMLGVQLVARIRELFGVKLTLRQLFNAPTVSALTGEVARLVGAKHD